MNRAFKYKMKPTTEQEVLLQQCFGCCRFIYNWGLNIKKDVYEKEGKSVSYAQLANRLTELKKEKEHKWLNDISSVCLQQSLRNLETAYNNFFRKSSKFPKFKSKKRGTKSAKFIQGVHFDFEKWEVKVPRIGWVKLCYNKQFDQSQWIGKTLTVNQDSCRTYWCSITCSNAEQYPVKAKQGKSKALGIDMGIKDFAIFSDGRKISNPRFARRQKENIAHLQKYLARKCKGSHRYEIARVRLAKAHRYVRNCRNDFLHKLTTSLANDNRYTTFCLETLNEKGLIQNYHLAGAIADASWYEFNRMLEYKCEMMGKNVIHIGRFEPSSKTCSVCGYRNSDLRLSDRVWVCPQCGTVHDRDINAAINIKEMAFSSFENTNNPIGGAVGTWREEVANPVKCQCTKKNNV